MKDNKGKFIKGNKGKPKGANNKVTQAVRIKFQELLDNNLDKIQSDLDQLEPKDRVKLLLDLAKFVIPQLKAVELSQDPDNSFTPVVIDMSEWK